MRHVRNTTSHDVLSGPVKTITSFSKDGELHNGWATMVRFLVGQILSSHHYVMENSGHRILFNGARSSLFKVIAARAKC
jgi:hypothetical protein